MQVIETVSGMREARASMPGSVALVPTLGGLHAGHEALFRAARGRAATVVASLFLNPTQFGENEDLARYPADRESDLDLMRLAGVDCVFAPSVDEMYPRGDGFSVDPGPIGELLEGAGRPGHFRGVATVVAKLFIAVRPDLAFFGEKDAQQLVVVQRLATDMLSGIRVVPVTTVRDPDGLALSSRNAYLSVAERRAATVLYRALSQARRLWDNGERDPARLETAIRADVGDEPLATLEYAALVEPDTFHAPSGGKPCGPPLLALVAATFGGTRLIDNIRLT